MSYSPDGCHLAVTRGLTVGPRLLTVPDGRDVPLPEGAILREFSPDGLAAVCFLRDGSGGLADLATGEPAAHFPLGEPIGRTGAAADLLNLPRRAVAVSADGRRVAFAHGDGRVSVWDAATGKELTTLRGPTRALRLAFRPDGRQVAAVTLDQGLYVWELAAGDDRILAPVPEQAAFSALAVSPDGRTVAALCDPVPRDAGDPRRTELVLWDLPTGRERLRRDVPGLWAGWAPDGVGGLLFSPDGQRLAAAGVTGEVSADRLSRLRRALSVWDVARGVELFHRRYDGPREEVAPCQAPPEVFGARFTDAGRLVPTL